MEDGPGAMRDSKPAQKVDNAVQLFSKAHDAEYQTRSRASRDLVQEAELHNRVHPTLRDELQKRRSIARITAAKRVQTCRVCAKRGRTMFARPKWNRTIRKRKTKVNKLSVNKRKTPHAYTERRRIYVPITNKVTSARESPARSDYDIVDIFKTYPRNVPKSNVSSGYPVSSKASRSLSSYHSYLSANHEPML